MSRIIRAKEITFAGKDIIEIEKRRDFEYIKDGVDVIWEYEGYEWIITETVAFKIKKE